ncbi:MAG: hypothetical protein ABI266_06540 [Ginsengibacter sp.]
MNVNKKINYSIILILFSLVMNAQNVEGVWMRTACSGGMTPRIQIMKDTFLIAFKGDQYFEGTKVNDLKNVGHFSVKNGKSIFSKESQLLTIDERSETLVIRTKDDRLSLVANTYDGKGCSYTKWQNGVDTGLKSLVEIECSIDFDKEIVLKKIPKSKIKTALNWQKQLIENNLVISLFDVAYQVSDAESLTVKDARPINFIAKAIQTYKLKNGDTRLHFLISTDKAIKKNVIVQVSYNNKAFLASVAKIASYKKHYNGVTILTDKVARMQDNEGLKEDCFQAALSIDHYSGDAKWKPYFFDLFTWHSRFGKDYLEDNYFRSCSKTNKMKFNLRFFVNKINAG